VQHFLVWGLNFLLNSALAHHMNTQNLSLRTPPEIEEKSFMSKKIII